MDIKKLRKLLSRGSQTAPALLDDVTEELNPIASRASSLEADEILGGSNTKVKPDIEIPEAELVPPKGPSAWEATKQFAKENPKKIIGGLTLAEMARQMMGQDETPVMMTPPQAKQKPEEQPKADAKIANAVQKAQTTSIGQSSKEFHDQSAAEASEEASPKLDFMKILSDAQAREEEGLRGAGYTRAGELIGTGLARITPNHGSSDIEREQAKLFTERAKGQIGAAKEQQGYDKANEEINDEKALSDPNSKISQETKAQLAKYGINVKTAKEAKQLNPQIFNLLMADRAQQNQKEIAGMNTEATKNKLSTTLDEKQRKFARDLRKEATTGVLGKQYATYSTGQRMAQGLSEFAKNPSGYKDYATLMGGLKTLQGDESVVREAEVRLGINATSAINKALNYLNAAANGQQLQPSQRKEMIDTINILNEASRKQYMQSVAPILEQADAEGIPHSTILSGSLSGAAEAPSSSAAPAVGKVMKLQNQKQAGAVITTRDGKTFKVNADGMTATEM